MPERMRETLETSANEPVGVSAISCWEVAKLVERGRLELSMELSGWLGLALEPSGITVLPLTPLIAIASTRLP